MMRLSLKVLVALVLASGCDRPVVVPCEDTAAGCDDASSFSSTRGVTTTGAGAGGGGQGGRGHGGRGGAGGQGGAS